MLSSKLLLSTAAAFIGSALAQSTIWDDQSGQISYRPDQGGIWLQDDNQMAVLNNRTISYSNSPRAWYTFNFTGTGFSIWYGDKRDRGAFLVQIDGVFAGSGDAFDGSVSDEQEAKRQYEISRLSAAPHRVEVYNKAGDDARIPGGGQPFLALDYVQVQLEQATTTTGQGPTGYPSQTTSVGSQFDPNTNSNGGITVGAIIGAALGSAAAVVLMASLIGYLLYRRHKRRRRSKKAGIRRSTIDDGDVDDNANLPTPSPYNVQQRMSQRSSMWSDLPEGASGASHGFLPQQSPYSAYFDSPNTQPSSPPSTEDNVSSHRATSSYARQSASAFQEQDRRSSVVQEETDGNHGLPPPTYENAASSSMASPTRVAPMPIHPGRAVQHKGFM